jgi:hypothetical protein
MSSGGTYVLVTIDKETMKEVCHTLKKESFGGSRTSLQRKKMTTRKRMNELLLCG